MDIIATINGEDITAEMLDNAVGRYIVQLEEDEEAEFKPTKENLKYIKTEVLNFLIERILLLKRVEIEGIDVSRDAILQNIQIIRKNFASAEEWNNNLLALKISEDNLFNEIKKDMMIEKFLDNNLVNKVQFGEKELLDYYQENETTMKEPDLFTFYEVYANNAGEVKNVYTLLQNNTDVSAMKDGIKSIGLELHNHTDIPSYQLPEEVYNVLADLEPGKIASMQASDAGMLVYKMINKTPGKKLVFDEIKEKLADYLIKASKQELMEHFVSEEMEKAKIEYKNMSYLEK